ncbi:MAG: energy-coupling factor transporter transmembrane protein EcfT [Lachnospiraceae bacterium]|nr:MAG: energy-coupling factor transporter transmembrane protein EcfT [Lachnospiraceae bacterium]
MTNQTLPDWMMREEITVNDSEVKSSFLQSNLSTVISLLSYLKIEDRKKYSGSPVIRICELLILLVLIYNSKSIVFLWTVGIFLLAEIAFFSGREIRSIVKKLIRLIIFTSVILLPSYLLHPSIHPTFFLIRTVLLLLNLSVFLTKTSWSDFITGLRGLYLPQELVMIFDIAIKYFYILGNHIKSILYAIRIRSLQGVSKKLTGAILGQVYLISKEHMKSLYEAMLLRGYGTKVKVRRKLQLNKSDILHISICIILIILFFTLKGQI